MMFSTLPWNNCPGRLLKANSTSWPGWTWISSSAANEATMNVSEVSMNVPTAAAEIGLAMLPSRICQSVTKPSAGAVTVH